MERGSRDGGIRGILSLLDGDRFPRSFEAGFSAGLAMIDGWIRRRVFWYLRREVVAEWGARKIGRCNRCGRCCRGCPAFDVKGMRCRIYSRRPEICKAFPLVPMDIAGVESCGYDFGPEVGTGLREI
ncbi:YkgJ family cysteine cluster protein [Methanotrichaceae archaeon M04Ac]|uniref:YkgJ family cysteine cluster protein n=1 Tax=Candidatus Methanocrinis alkalitolerans TaxID=3033395 RepID=A0ABT5XCP8_9EURY|nr:YkgJ family cysteine cluster protein [Candidatus Methanocrinis alkalitolerans]MCR3884771.1 YkgJ family cysteine cluster protein [Methanothrix sp.]MDF0592442.1 YkgJ family cysteine cluster protein [Candidatus Methanocrinis alkalitolerans]